MALNEPKMRSITGKLVANKLTERDDDFSFNVTYQGKSFSQRLMQAGCNEQ